MFLSPLPLDSVELGAVTPQKPAVTLEHALRDDAPMQQVGPRIPIEGARVDFFLLPGRAEHAHALLHVEDGIAQRSLKGVPEQLEQDSILAMMRADAYLHRLSLPIHGQIKHGGSAPIVLAEDTKVAYVVAWLEVHGLYIH